MTGDWTRRDVLRTAGLVGAGLLMGGAPAARAARLVAPAARPGGPRRRALRVAHLTDMHIQPERQGGAGMAACWKHLAGQADKPDLVLTGGDTVMDSFDEDEARTKLQWELWNKVKADECGFEMASCLGNHDVWGWNKKKSKTKGDEARYGKKWACEMFGVERPYRSFDKSGWHFVILDSTFPEGGGYIGKLDDEQMAWLGADLAAVKPETPVLVLSHIPILSSTALMDSGEVVNNEWRASGSLMHVDAQKFRDLFLKHRNVKACLSGHMHLVERTDYNGVSYLCNGAVSGNWWKGKHKECDNGYALLNLYDDGTFESDYVTYGWQAKP